MKTIANRVKSTIEGQCPDNFSLCAGYGLKTNFGLSRNVVHFPVGALLDERRNESGRVTMARYKYADDSELEFQHKEPGWGYRLTATKYEKPTHNP